MAEQGRDLAFVGLEADPVDSLDHAFRATDPPLERLLQVHHSDTNITVRLCLEIFPIPLLIGADVFKV